MSIEFDILIIGAGHAGVEAAWIAAQFGLSIGVITSPQSGIASAPCNPAVGGVGKGQVVREIDSLGGLMGILADKAGIQFRTLNESKGFAVQSTRVQIDKDLYTKYAEEMISSLDNIIVVRTIIRSINKSEDFFVAIDESGNIYKAKKIIVTTGTFLGGKLHTGEIQTVGGRVGCTPSVGLNGLLDCIKTVPARFKTGTPPRINVKTVNFSKMEEQKSDPATRNFHLQGNPFKRESQQVSCYLTKTSSDTLSIIRQNKERSPIFNGQIKGVGPRYCPSIEDKAFRYTEKDVHHVFIEPEGLSCDTIYPNGVSTSLPKDVQESFIRTIEGLEEAKIEIYGYAVEYDVVDTTQLSRTLEHKDLAGLYFAGQVCGTSGYEEAAGQGIVAGINACLAFLGKSPLILDRSESYIGVMIEDLVGNKRDEPYRLFTARSENRLYIREDNTLLRMAKYRQMLGLNSEIDTFHDEFIEEVELLSKLVSGTMYYSNESNKEYFSKNNYGPIENNLSLSELLKRPGLNPIEVLVSESLGFGASFNYDVVKTVAIAVKYEGYIDRALVENDKLNRLSKKIINWERLSSSANISFECKIRIKNIRPETFGQLQRIEGIRPATLAYVAGNLV